MSLKLTVCIPTYNRAALIGHSLESIISQATENLEIVIVDGGSSDNTKDIVDEFRQSFTNIVYFRRQKNIGVDADILKAVELARGDYCWLMSDDDRMQPGALKHVMSELAKYRDIAGASVNYMAYDKEMRFEVRTVPAASGGRLSSDFLFTNPEECFSILGIHLGYLSAQIVNKRVWAEVVSKTDLGPYYNCWLLVYIIGQMLRCNAQWLYIHRKCIGYRSGNDSFIVRVGPYNRQLITHVAFDKIVVDLFGKRSLVYQNVFNTLISDRMGRSLAVLKANGASLTLQLGLFRLYARQYWRFPRYWIQVAPVFLAPNTLLKIVRAVYLRMRSRTAGRRQPTSRAAVPFPEN